MTAVAAEEPRRLPRVLQFFDISVLASAAMGPAYSLASTMGPVVAAAGTLSPLALLSISSVMLCIAISFSLLSRIAPSAGSSYSWIYESFGTWIGAYGAWLLLLSNFFATMAIAVPAGSYTLELVDPARSGDPVWVAAVGAVWIVASTALLYWGVRPTALITLLALAFEMIVIVAAAVVASVMPPHAAVAAASTGASGGVPLTFAGFVTAMTLGIWMSDGWEVSASASEEVEPGNDRAAGRGGIAALVVTTVVLVGCMTAFLHLGGDAGFALHQADSLAYVATLLGGGWWRWLIVTAVMLSTITTLWTTVLYLTRSTYAMGRDGVLPRLLGRLDRRNEPFWSLVIICVLTTICELATGFSQSAANQLNILVNVSSVFLGLLFVFSAAATVKRFAGESGVRVRGVLVPAAGALALLGIIVATVVLENRVAQLYALGGIVLGIPFALWRGARVRAAGRVLAGRGSI